LKVVGDGAASAADKKWVREMVAEKVPVRRMQWPVAQWFIAAISDAGGLPDAVKSDGCACSMSRSAR